MYTFVEQRTSWIARCLGDMIFEKPVSVSLFGRICHMRFSVAENRSRQWQQFQSGDSKVWLCHFGQLLVHRVQRQFVRIPQDGFTFFIKITFFRSASFVILASRIVRISGIK